MDDQTANPYIDWFRHSSPYINAHRHKTFVILLSGEALDDPHLTHTIHDIVLLNSLGVRLVLAYGARPQIERALQRRGLSSQLHYHQRVTDQTTLEAVIEASAVLRTQLEALFSMGLVNTPMHGARIRLVSGNFVTAKPAGVVNGIDLGHTGEVRRIDVQAIQHQLNLDHIVLLPHLGFSPTGEVFNLSSEDVAVHAAKALQADKLILLGSEEGIYNSQGDLRSEILAETARRWVKHYLAQRDNPSQAYSETARLLQTAVDACEAGINRCHLISYQKDGALIKELYTREGSGTMVIKESYEQIRWASIEDVGGIVALIEPLELNGVLVKRSREKLETEVQQFLVIERDQSVIGCAALYPFWEDKTAELACVVIDSHYRGQARAEHLLKHVETEAKRLGLASLFVLTTKTAHWFIEHGFSPASLTALPEQKKTLYNFQRNSKVFVKHLS